MLRESSTIYVENVQYVTLTQIKILSQVSTTLHLGGSNSKETPKLSDRSGWDQNFGPKDFSLGSKSKAWKKWSATTFLWNHSGPPSLGYTLTSVMSPSLCHSLSYIPKP